MRIFLIVPVVQPTDQEELEVLGYAFVIASDVDSAFVRAMNKLRALGLVGDQDVRDFRWSEIGPVPQGVDILEPAGPAAGESWPLPPALRRLVR